MPAYAEEIDEAVSEGVELRPLVQPVEVVRDGSGAISAVRCAGLSLGEFDRSGRRRPMRGESQPFDIEADQVIVAIGQRLDTDETFVTEAVKRDDDGFLRADPVTGQTADPWIFAGGDDVLGPASVVDAIAAGERAAYGIDLYLTGEDHAFWRREMPVDTQFDPDADPLPYDREPLETIPVEQRRHNFSEVELPWAEAIAIRQAKRCLRCDYGKAPVKEDVHA
jgi:NADH-quinone oxidoreductase subunit F